MRPALVREALLEQEVIGRDWCRMSPFVIGNANDVHRVQNVLLVLSLDLLLDEGAAVEEQAVVHVRFREALHLAEEFLLGGFVGADDIEDRAPVRWLLNS